VRSPALWPLARAASKPLTGRDGNHWWATALPGGRWVVWNKEHVAAAESFTPREREVLALLARGLSNRDIADALEISAHTAKFHVNSILQKLGVERRTEAVVRAARMGLVTL